MIRQDSILHSVPGASLAGDVVKEDDVIAQLETDKVTIDVKYTGKQPGIINSLQVKPQDVVQVCPGVSIWVGSGVDRPWRGRACQALPTRPCSRP